MTINVIVRVAEDNRLVSPCCFCKKRVYKGETYIRFVHSIYQNDGVANVHLKCILNAVSSINE